MRFARAFPGMPPGVSFGVSLGVLLGAPPAGCDLGHGRTGMIAGVDTVCLLLVVLAAMLLDVLAGGPSLLGRLPGPDRFMTLLAERVRSRLGAPAITPVAGTLYGVLVLTAALALLALAGLLLNRVLLVHPLGLAVASLPLALITGQALTRETAGAVVTALGGTLRDTAEEKYAAARWAVERIAFRLGDGLIISSLLFLVGGFATLLPYRLLSMASAVAVPSGMGRPRGLFDRCIQTVFQSVSFPFVVVARLLVAAALVAVPGARPGAALLAGPAMPERAQSMTSRRWLLGAFLYGLELNAALDPAAAQPVWIGPSGGRVRLGAADVTRVLRVSMAVRLLFALLLAAALVLQLGGAG